MKLETLLAHPTPREGAPLSVQLLVRIVGDPPSRERRSPMNLALVLDRSGSMAGEPLTRAREAAALLLRRIWPEDVASVVVYDHDVRVLMPPTTGTGHQEAIRRLEEVLPGGTTNLGGGWMQGRDLARERLLRGGVNRVILFTDGLANQGITDPYLLTQLCRDAAREGVATTTIGFGPDFNEDLLRAMAEAGGGSTYYVERPDQMDGVFEEEVEGLLSLALRDLDLTVTPEGGCRLDAVRHRYRREDRPGGGVRLELGELYAREPRLALLEFTIPEVTTTQGVHLATLTAHGLVPWPGVETPGPGEGGLVAHTKVEGEGAVRSELRPPELRTEELSIRFTPGTAAREDAEVARTALLLDAARAREEALERHARGDWEGARQSMVASSQVMADFAHDDPELMQEWVELRQASAAFADQAISPSDVKYMKQQLHDEGLGRRSARGRIRRG